MDVANFCAAMDTLIDQDPAEYKHKKFDYDAIAECYSSKGKLNAKVPQRIRISLNFNMPM